MNWLKSKDQNLSVWRKVFTCVSSSHKSTDLGVYSLNTSLKANLHCTGRCLSMAFVFAD